MLTNAILQTLFESCHNLAEIEIYGVSLSSIAELIDEPILCSYYPTLTQLTVYGDGVTASTLRDIFTYCTNLREISLSCADINDETIMVLSQNCCKLESLVLDCYITKLTAKGLLEVATYCTNLTSLQLLHVSIGDEFLIQLSQHCINLKHIYLDHCGYTATDNTDTSLTDSDSGAGTGRSPLSESDRSSISETDRSSISETGIVAVLEKCIKLKVLTIIKCNVTITHTLHMIEQGKLYPHVSFAMEE